MFCLHNQWGFAAYILEGNMPWNELGFLKGHTKDISLGMMLAVITQLSDFWWMRTGLSDRQGHWTGGGSWLGKCEESTLETCSDEWFRDAFSLPHWVRGPRSRWPKGECYQRKSGCSGIYWIFQPRRSCRDFKGSLGLRTGSVCTHRTQGCPSLSNSQQWFVPLNSYHCTWKI